MAAGKYREIVKFYQPGLQVSDGLGGFKEGVETSFTAYAQVQVLTAKEVLQNGQLTCFQPYKIFIRYTDQASQSTRCEWNDVQISINSVTQDERRTQKIIMGYGAANG